MSARRRVLSVSSILVVVIGATAAAALAGAISWGSAIEVPGTAGLNGGGAATVNSVSCPSAGNCAAGGSYVDGSGHRQAYVSAEHAGVWGTAIEVPGTAHRNAGGFAQVYSVSCASAGNCAAGGTYTDASNVRHAYVVNEAGGVWGAAIDVRGTAYGHGARVNSVSCRGAGACVAGGFYVDGSSHSQAFVVMQHSGVWGRALEVPHTAALNVGGSAYVASVSCTGAGNCAAGGTYTDGASHGQAFVVTEHSGVWRNAIEAPHTGALNLGGLAGVTSVSCASAGNCAAGGIYKNGSGHYQAFVVDERSGVWGLARAVPGTAALNHGGYATVTSVSCAGAGECSAGGTYRDTATTAQGFVVSEHGGVWHTAIRVPGSLGSNSSVESVSCGGAGYCAAGGFYSDSPFTSQAFLVAENGGVWSTRVEVPGTAALNLGGGGATHAVSCASTGYCVAGGSYTDGADTFQAFVTTP